MTLGPCFTIHNVLLQSVPSYSLAPYIILYDYFGVLAEEGALSCS